MKKNRAKYLFSFSLFLAIGLGVAIYYFIKSKQPNIFYVKEMVHNGDTIYYTLENYIINHKTGSPDRGVLVHSYNTKSSQLVVNQKVNFNSLENDAIFLGTSNSFVWFCRNEKLVLVYPFKEDSVLEEEASTKLLNTFNPGTKLANITYAPTRGVVYAQITNGDQFVINPNTFKYVSVKTELESYKYALLPNNKIENSGERLNVDSLELIFIDSKKPSNLKKHIETEVYSANGNSYHLVFEDTVSKIENEFINPKFLLYQNNIALIEHHNQIGDSAQLLITAFDVKTRKFIWQQNVNALFNTEKTKDAKTYCSLNGSYFYLTTDAMLPIKVNLNTGNIKY